MFRIATTTLLKTRRLVQRDARASYIRGYWPEPITQQTLSDFLKDINYFDQPVKVKNIGLDKKIEDNLAKRLVIENENESKSSGSSDSSKQQQVKSGGKQANKADVWSLEDGKIDSRPVEEILTMLSDEPEVPQLDYDDAKVCSNQLINLAFNHGIYRDLFRPNYVPDREHIPFTKEQAERLDLLVPYYWITDQPFARVPLKSREEETLDYFEPVVGVSARFINKIESESNVPDDDLLFAHASYYGNIVPACEASSKPSITLDGSLLQTTNTSNNVRAIVKESEYKNWNSGDVTAVNFNLETNNKFYTVALVNLDHLKENSANLHWMIANIKPSAQNSNTALKYDEICKYLPVHGINGFGYSRYVFVVFQHDAQVNIDESRINNFSIEARSFDANSFLRKHKNLNMIPVGLSWFQTTWDISSNKIFHDFLGLKAPVYEHIQDQPLPKEINNEPYPGIVPFNIFLDHGRKKKDINEQVLLERLKSVDPTQYEDQYVPPKVPPTVFVDEDIPSWMQVVMKKKKNKIGYWRGLRPASAILPLNNNADLDYPLLPVPNARKLPPDFPNQFPGRKRYKKYKGEPVDHQPVYIQESHEIHLDKVKQVTNEFDTKKK